MLLFYPSSLGKHLERHKRRVALSHHPLYITRVRKKTKIFFYEKSILRVLIPKITEYMLNILS